MNDTVSYTSEIQIRVKDLPFWDVLSEDEKEMVSMGASIVSFDKGAEIYNKSMSCPGFLNVLKGRVRAYILSEEGREVTICRLNRADFCALSAACAIKEITFEIHMVASEDCRLLIINPMVLEKIMESNVYVNTYVHELINMKFSSVMWTMQQILFYKLDKRIAIFLVEEYERTNSTIIRMTQEQIAQNINSARETVTRMLKHMEQEGLIKVERGKIKLIDIEKIIELST